jgi:membrane-bound serine protease (ClpP class)
MIRRRNPHRARRLSAFLALAGCFVAFAGTARAADGDVVVLPATGIVDNVLAGYLDEGIAAAAREGAAAVVVSLNTPGGSLDSTQRIVSTFLDAPLPVIVYVSPSGGRAASAGTFITLAAHVAVMAPGTNIGAASPVGGSGEDIEGTLGEKVKNDAIANIRAIAEARGRNVDWAIETVRDARSSPASEAVSVGAVDGIAGSLDEVLQLAHERTVQVGGSEVLLDLEGATVREAGMNPFQAFLHLLSDPNIAFILFTIGFYGLFFELQNPNFVTGILGALALILAFIGFGSLPLNVAGLLLIGLAVVLFFLELSVPSHGLLAIGGIICFALGASALYTTPGDPFEPVVRIGPPLLLVVTATTGAFMVLIVVAAARARGTGISPGLVGSDMNPVEVGVVRRPLDPLGSVFLAGEEWSARTGDGLALERGTAVRVVGRDGLTLLVTPVTEPAAPAARPST